MRGVTQSPLTDARTVWEQARKQPTVFLNSARVMLWFYYLVFTTYPAQCAAGSNGCLRSPWPLATMGKQSRQLQAGGPGARNMISALRTIQPEPVGTPRRGSNGIPDRKSHPAEPRLRGRQGRNPAADRRPAARPPRGRPGHWRQV